MQVEPTKITAISRYYWNLILKLIVLNLLGNSINSPDFERRWSVGVLAMQIYVDIYTLISCPYLNPRDRVYIHCSRLSEQG